MLKQLQTKTKTIIKLARVQPWSEKKEKIQLHLQKYYPKEKTKLSYFLVSKLFKALSCQLLDLKVIAVSSYIDSEAQFRSEISKPPT